MLNQVKNKDTLFYFLAALVKIAARPTFDSNENGATYTYFDIPNMVMKIM